MSKGKTVKRSVHVSNPETGDEAWLHPGDTVPDWAKDMITNPSVFEDDDETELNADNFPMGNVDYDTLTIAQLDELLAERGLDGGGSKKDKAARLKEADAAVS